MSFGFLERIALFASRRHRAVLLTALVVVLVALGFASRLRFDTDILNLLPQDDPEVDLFVEGMERFGGVDYLLVLVRIPEGQVPDPYQELVDRLGARLEALPELSRVEYQIEPPEDLLEALLPKSVLFLDEEGREALAERVTDEGLAVRASELRRQLTTPQSLALKDLLKLDPFGVAQLVLGRLEAARGNLAVDWASGNYVSQDGSRILILANPVSPPQDTAFDVRMVAAVEAEVAAVLEEWPEMGSGFGGGLAAFGEEGEAAEEDILPAPEVVLGGVYLTALDDYRHIKGDIIKNLLTSVALVLGLFLLAFRRLGPLLYALVPLACGLALTFGFSALTVGTLSSATSGTAALLIGLGIDFVIVSYGRYVEERRSGKGLEAALGVMARTSGRAVVVGAVTTAATFYAFLVTDFTGLYQMGLLVGTGILFCMVAVLVLVPALLTWSERRHQKKDSRPNLYLHSFGTDHLLRLAVRRPVLVLAVGAALTVASLASIPTIEFQEGMKTMRPEGYQGIEVGEEVAEHFRSGFDSMMMIVRGDDLEQLFARSERAVEAARALVDEGVLVDVSGLTTLVPSPQRQREALAWLEAQRQSGLMDTERIETTFAAALAEEGMRPAPFERGIDLFTEALELQKPLAPGDFAVDSQTRQLIERALQKDEDGWVSVLYLYPPENLWRRSPPPRVMAMAEELSAELGGGIEVTGPNVLNAHLRDRIRPDAVTAALLGLFLVLVLLWFDFGRVGDALLALVPLAIGASWMVGGMALFQIPMNFMNIFVFTMIIGIGVDYGIHAVHRHREALDGFAASGGGTDQEDLVAELSETGKAILVAALSTIAGFGSLATSTFPGLRSSGLVAILGALATAFVAITLLPAGLELARRRKGKSKRG